MLASRSMKPKLSLSISATVTQASRAASPLSPICRSPVSLRSPVLHDTNNAPTASPTAQNTRMNQRGHHLSQQQQARYDYVNYSSSRSILKKGSASTTPATRRRIQFSESPVVHCIAPIEEEDYYGTYRRVTREERRWQRP